MTQVRRKTFDKALLASVPPLPATIQYYDDFSDSYGAISNPQTSDRWMITFDGHHSALDFSTFETSLRLLLKSWCAWLFKSLSPVTADFYLGRLAAIPKKCLISLIECSPQDARSLWKQFQGTGISYSEFVSLKNLLTFLCQAGIAAWTPEWLDLVSQLPLPKIDKYAGVRTGDVFLALEEEAEIVRHIDIISARLQAQPSSFSDDSLEATAILLCSFQFGFRAKQIAMLEMRNIRIWNDGVDTLPTVHLKFTMVKQRSARRVFPMIRRVKREWAPVFVELIDRARRRGIAGSVHVFHRTPREVGQVILELTESLLQRKRSVVELRHTAAQRLVDAGASEEELAAFMGHTDLNTGLIYFGSSPSQAARINQALGVSATYQRVSRIAHDKFITVQELAELKGDQQIGGVPHGIPIAGVGGCSLGQPDCPYNPVMSCYGCSRFMPVAIAAVHQQVLEDLRGVMKFFYASSHAERGSPAFQLAGTISNVQAVLDELGGHRDELES